MSDRDAKLEKELLTLEEAKSEMLSKTFGEDKAKKIDEIRTKLAKSVFEARKNQVETQKATYAERKEVLKNVENVKFARPARQFQKERQSNNADMLWL